MYVYYLRVNGYLVVHGFLLKSGKISFQKSS